MPCSCSLKGAAAPLLEAACETSASSAHSWPCLADPRQKTSVFIWRLLRHLMELQIKGKEMCFEMEPRGRHRHQHANATRRWAQDEAGGEDQRCQEGFACTGTQQSPRGTSGTWELFVQGRRWELDVEAILGINDNGVDCSWLVHQNNSTKPWRILFSNFLLMSHLRNPQGASCGTPCARHSSQNHEPWCF